MRIRIRSNVKDKTISGAFSVTDEQRFVKPRLKTLEIPIVDDQGMIVGYEKNEKKPEPEVPEVTWTDAGPKDAKATVGDLLARTNVSSGLLPPAVRYISSDHKTVAFERPPMHVVVEYAPYPKDTAYNDAAVHYTFNIAVPWSVYVICFDDFFLPINTFMFFRNKPLTSLDDPVGLAPLLNFYYTSKLCPPLQPNFSNENPSIANGINEAYNLVWNSGFNLDLVDAMKEGSSHGTPFSIYGDSTTEFAAKWYKSWERMSIDDILRVKWPRPRDMGEGSNFVRLWEAIHWARRDAFGASTLFTRNMNTDARQFMVNIINTVSL